MGANAFSDISTRSVSLYTWDSSLDGAYTFSDLSTRSVPPVPSVQEPRCDLCILVSQHWTCASSTHWRVS